MKMFRDRFNIPFIINLKNQSSFHAICIDGYSIPRTVEGTYAVSSDVSEDTDVETEELQNESLQLDSTPDEVYRANKCAGTTIAVNICLATPGQYFEYHPKREQETNVLDSILSRPKVEVHVNNAHSRNAVQEWKDLHLKFAHKSYKDLEYMRRYKLVRGLEQLLIDYPTM